MCRHLLPLLVAGLAALAGCRSPAADVGAPSASASGVSSGPLPSRPEAVVEADALALRGSRLGGKHGAELTRQAAELRLRLWRLERREPDALEAVELLKGLEQGDAEQACEATLERALLEGELRQDPAETYRAVHLVRAAEPPKPCQLKAKSVLDTLSAYKPLPTELAELEREAGIATRDAGAAGAAQKTRVDERGPVVVPTLGATRPAGPARITTIERYGSKDAARVVVFVTHPTLFDVGYLKAENGRGPRLYVDIAESRYKGKLEYKVGGLVESVRVGKQAKGTRIVLDLREDVYRKIFYLPEPFRLVFDVSTQPPEAPSLVVDAGATRPIRRVVLDPGHGGHDPGASGPVGLREKDVTLDIAHRAAPLIARELGIATLLTRDSDVYVALDERTARANAFGADLFVSIHCNASENTDAHGVMTFVLAESRDQLASHVAARENAASPAAAAELANVLSRVLDQGMAGQSLHFAGLLQRSALGSLRPSYPISDQGVKRAGFYVLAGARMPAVLFESSFISNPAGELRLNTGDYRQKLADAIVNAVRAYRDGR